MPIRKIPHVNEANKILHTASKTVAKDDIQTHEIQSLIDDLIETASVADGVGIASPQIGVLKRIAVVHLSDGARVVINPKIITSSDEKIESEEGCLSIPKVFGIVMRYKKIKIKALDRNGQPVRITASGIDSIIIQHEIDHLNGILFIDPQRLVRYKSELII